LTGKNDSKAGQEMEKNTQGTNPAPPQQPRQSVSAAERKLVFLWAAGMVVVFGVGGALAIRTAYQNRVAALERHTQRIDPNANEEGLTAAEPSAPEGEAPVTVECGIYLDRIVEISIRDMTWTADFYLWFNWIGDLPDPGENVHVVDGWIESKEKQQEVTVDGVHHTMYRVVAKITKLFDVSRFPCDDHVLTINLEHPSTQRHELIFLADQRNSEVSSRVGVAGYEIRQVAALEKPHAYRTTRGDPRLAAGTRSVYSQFRLGIWIGRPDWGLYSKMFLSLFVATTIAMLALFVKPTHVDPRFGLGVGALFAAVANSYVTSTLVPDTGISTLADMVNDVSIVTVLFTIVQSTISLYVLDTCENAALTRLFDRTSFVILFVGYVVLNLALPWAASVK
jgi:hypothetical protein